MTAFLTVKEMGLKKRRQLSLRVDKEVFSHLFFFFLWGVRGLPLNKEPKSIGS